MDDWFNTLVGGGLGAYQANQNAQAAIATANANAVVAERNRQDAQQARLDALNITSTSQNRIMMYGMGLFALLFLVRATGKT